MRNGPSSAVCRAQRAANTASSTANPTVNAVQIGFCARSTSSRVTSALDRHRANAPTSTIPTQAIGDSSSAATVRPARPRIRRAVDDRGAGATDGQAHREADHLRPATALGEHVQLGGPLAAQVVANVGRPAARGQLQQQFGGPAGHHAGAPVGSVPPHGATAPSGIAARRSASAWRACVTPTAVSR